MQPPEKKILTINRGEVITLPLKRRKIVVDLAPELAETLMPSEIRSEVGLVTITAELKVKDNKLKIEVCVNAECHCDSAVLLLYQKVLLFLVAERKRIRVGSSEKGGYRLC